MMEIRGKRSNSSIKKKILLLAGITLVVVSVVLTLVNVHYINQSTEDALELSMRETAKIAADRVSGYLTLKKDIIISVANRVSTLNEEYITAPYDSIDVKDFEAKIEQMTRAFSLNYSFVVDKDGMARTSKHTNIAKLAPEYYTRIAIDGDAFYMSEITQDQGTLGGYVINFSAPLHDDFGNNIGVFVCKLDADFLSKLVSDISIGENGRSFIMDGDGICIAHPDPTMRYGGEKFVSINNNPEYKRLNKLWDDMYANSSGFMEYDYEGTRFAAYDTIEGTTNWAIAVTADKAEFLEGTTQSVLASIIIGIILLIVAFIVVTFVIGSITGRITSITHRIERLSNGDLTDDVQLDNGTDEVSRLIFATKNLITILHSMIDSISDVLAAMSEGDLQMDVTGEYPGDFIQLKTSVERNMIRLSDMVEHISRTAEEVSRGSTQIADGATSLAQGASEQAGSVEELYNTISELNKQAKEIAVPNKKRLDDEEHDESSDSEEAQIEAAETLVDKLKLAMSSIEHRLSEVRKISNAVEHMSSETGMLALNAAVEATHAGEYGKGFSVIASEIRELSEQSKSEVKNSDEQINRIMQSIDRGNRVVSYTVDSVESIIVALSQVEKAVKQISSVIEGTAATAEESAAGSEELSAQAEVLKELASSFKIRQKDDSNTTKAEKQQEKR